MAIKKYMLLETTVNEEWHDEAYVIVVELNRRLSEWVRLVYSRFCNAYIGLDYDLRPYETSFLTYWHTVISRDNDAIDTLFYNANKNDVVIHLHEDRLESDDGTRGLNFPRCDVHEVTFTLNAATVCFSAYLKHTGTKIQSVEVDIDYLLSQIGD